MDILVDADACPVKEIIVRLAKKENLPVTMLIDTSHALDYHWHIIHRHGLGRCFNKNDE